MNTKITLYSEKELIERIKKYAKSKNTSVSKIVNEFFKSLLEKEESAPVTNSLAGILKGKNLNKDDFCKHIEDKYL